MAVAKPATKNRDAEEMKNQFGIKDWDPDRYESHQFPYPSVLSHGEPNPYGKTGGQNLLLRAKYGAGKSTLMRHMVIRLLEINPEETVVMRGATDTEEWLSLRPWTRVLVPENMDVNAYLVDKTGEQQPLRHLVKDYVEYSDPRDIFENRLLEKGSFHVIYPDPSFTGCDDIMNNASIVSTEVQHLPKWRVDPDEDEEATPLGHWWYAFLVAYHEAGDTFTDEDGNIDHWISLLVDEFSELFNQSASNDTADEWNKLDALTRAFNHFRKRGFSWYGMTQYASDVHEKIRRRFQYRGCLADAEGTGNPRKARRRSYPLGFQEVPMKYNMLASKPVGHGLVFTENAFTPFTWPNIPKKLEQDRGRTLKVKLSRKRRRKA